MIACQVSPSGRCYVAFVKKTNRSKPCEARSQVASVCVCTPEREGESSLFSTLLMKETSGRKIIFKIRSALAESLCVDVRKQERFHVCLFQIGSRMLYVCKELCTSARSLHTRLGFTYCTVLRHTDTDGLQRNRPLNESQVTGCKGNNREIMCLDIFNNSSLRCFSSRNGITQHATTLQ